MKPKTGMKLLSFLLTLAMVIGMFPVMTVTVQAEVYSFGYCYDCGRTPSYPREGWDCRLDAFMDPLVGWRERGTTPVGNWTLNYIDLYKNCSNLSTDPDHNELYNIVRSIVNSYGLESNDVVPIYELKDGNKHIAYGVIIASVNDGNQYLFFGDTWSYGAGYVVSVTELDTTQQMYVVIQQDVLDFVQQHAHEHSFTYSADGSTVTAACSENDCPLDDGQGNHTTTLTIGAPALTTYGGTQSPEAIITDPDSIKSTAEVSYYATDENNGKTGSALTAAPTDPGTYWAEITIGPGTDNKTATANVVYTIAKAALTNVRVEDVVLTYDSSAQTPQPVTSATSVNDQPVTFTYSKSESGTYGDMPSFTNVSDSCTVYFKASAPNHEDSFGSFNVTMNKTTPPSIDVPILDEVVYAPSNTLANIQLTDGWEWVDDTIVPTVVNEGYPASLTVNDSNYDYTGVDGYNKNTHKVVRTVSLTVNEANSYPSTVTAKDRVYDGTKQPLVTVDDSTLVGGTMQYAVAFTDSTPPAISEFTTSIPEAEKVNTYYVFYRVDVDSNYRDDGIRVKPVTISQAKPTITTPENLSAQCGTKVSDITLPDGFKFVPDDGVVEKIGDNSFTLVYTPDDTENYETVENITVNVAGVGIHHEAKPATCEEDGVIEYWEDGAGNKFADENGKTPVTDVTDKATGHTWVYDLAKSVWDGFTRFIAWFTCENNPDEVMTIDVATVATTDKEPACEEDGYINHTAAFEVDGKTYSEVNVETIDQLGHAWKESEWNIDGTKASVTLVCDNDPSETKTVDAVVGVVENEDGTVRTYTAKVTVDGVEYTKTWTEDISAETTDTPETSDTDTNDEPDTDTSDEPDTDTSDEPDPGKKILRGLLGDVNNDRVIDSADALLILRRSVDLDEFDDLQNLLGDVDFDKEYTSADALADLRYSVDLIDNPKIGTEVESVIIAVLDE